MPKTDELVPQAALDELKALDAQLAASAAKMREVFTEANNIRRALSDAALSYKDLVAAIGKFEAIQKQAATTEREAKKAMTEKERLQQRIIKLETAEGAEVQKLRLELQKKTQATKDDIRAQQAAEGSLNQLRAALIRARKEYDAMGASVRNSAEGMRKADQIRGLHSQVLLLEQSTGRSQRNVGNYFGAIKKGLGSVLGIATVAGLAVRAVTAITGAVSEGYKAFVEYDAAVARLAAAAETDRKGVKALTDEAKRLSSEMGVSVTGIVEMQTELAKLGRVQTEIIDGTEPIILFAKATGAEFGEAAKLAGQVVNQFGADSKETARYVSAMSVATARSALDFNDLTVAMEKVGPLARTYGFSVEDTLALLGKLSDAGIDASSAGTALKNILLNLADANGKLAQKIGTNVKTLPDLAGALVWLRTELNAAGDSGKTLGETFELTGSQSVAAFNTFLNGAESITELRRELDKAEERMKEMARMSEDSLEGAAARASNAFKNLGISIYEYLREPIKEVLDAVAQMVQRAASVISKLGGRFLKLYNNSIIVRVAVESITGAFVILGNAAEVTVSLAARLIGGLANTIGNVLSFRFKEAKTSFENMLNGMDAALEKQKAGLDAYLTGSAGRIKNGVKAQGNDGGKKAGDGTATKEDIAAEIRKKQAELEAEEEKRRKLKEAEAERKKRAESERKAAQELAVFRIQTEADTEKRIADDANRAFGERLAAIRNYYQAQAEAVRQAAENQLDNGDLTASQRELIQQKLLAELEKLEYNYVKDVTDLENDRVKSAEEAAQKRIKIQEKLFRSTERGISADESAEIGDLTAEYAAGRMKHEKYEEQKADITRRYAEVRMNAEADHIRSLMGLAGLSADQQEQLAQKLADAEIKYEQYMADTKIAIDLKAARKREEIERDLAEKRKELLGEALSFAETLISAQFEGRLNEIDREQEALEKSAEAEIKRIEEQEEAGVLSREQADAQKGLIEYNAQLRSDMLEEKRRQTLERQAKFEKASTVTGIALNTALAIMAQLASTSLPLGAPLVAFIAATGALQLAAALAQPLPKYARGTADHPGGLAVVGDGGRREIGILPDGRRFLTPDRPTLMDLPPHTGILPDAERVLGREAARLNGRVETRAVIVEMNAEPLEEGQKATNERLDAIARCIRKIRLNARYSSRMSRLDRTIHLKKNL